MKENVEYNTACKGCLHKVVCDDYDVNYTGHACVHYSPAADVTHVKHGEWNIKSETIQMLDDVDEEIYIECPYCKRTFYVPFEFEDEKILSYARKNYPYCNCGAKMDGDTKKEVGFYRDLKNYNISQRLADGGNK